MSIAIGPEPSCHHTMPQLTTAAKATTPVPIRSGAATATRAASADGGDSDGARDGDCRRRARPARGHAGAGSTRPHATPPQQLIPEPVMRSRKSPRSRGPSPRISGASAAGPFAVPVSHEISPVPPALYRRHIPRHIGAAKASKGRHMTVPQAGRKGARFHPAARRRRHRVARRLQGPQAGAVFLPQGRHAGLHQGGDRLQRAQGAPSPRPTPTSSASRPTRCKAQDKFRDKHELKIALASDEEPRKC